MTVSEDLAEQLRDARARLDTIDRQRAELVAERDRLIIEARDGGGSLREVADLAGLSHQAVKLIAERGRT